MSKVGVADSSSSPSHLGDGSSGSGQTKVEPNKRPLIVAAYRYGEPFRKRRVKVPTNIKWKEFLALIYSRLEIDTNLNIEIYDEQGIEIVDVDDLVENDVLVVRDMPASMKSYPKSAAKGGKPVAPMVGGGGVGGREGGHGGEMIQRYPEQANSVSVPAVAVRSHDKSRDLGIEHSMMVSTPQLSHFIQLNSFGYYFLAEVENMKLVPTHGKIKKIHCIVKVPHCQKGAPRTFADEADLLRKVSNHKSIISPPSVQILNFSDDSLQHFFSSLLQQKQVVVRELFMSGGCMEAYIYPLYGVTMATRVKNGLTPDKVLKYSYQLADIMFYLQQRGVIHQNLLPENIQVMSNDRVVLCNFETAVQTNPTSCLLVAPQSVIAPGNRKGLAPEVVRSFSCLRVEGECIDYSTQYPWSFGVLSVLMATGLHPLKDYPESYEGGNKVKYRSHDYQALPDTEQYPPIFCKLVKRSLACDPIRRPTLPQILSIIKKDSKVIALMTGKRLGGPSSSTVAHGQQQRGVSTGGSGQERGLWGSMESINRHAQGGIELFESSKTTKSSKPNLPSSFSSKDFYDTHPPFANSHASRHLPNIDDTASDVTGYRRSSNLQHQQRTTRTEARHSSHYETTTTERMETSDPVLPTTGHCSAPTRRKQQRSSWDTFGGGGGEEQKQQRQQRQQQSNEFSFVPLAQSDHSPPMAVKQREGLTLRRYSSSGAFSDDFVLGPQLSRASSSRSVHASQAMRRVGSASRPHGSSERLLGRSGTTSESDLSQIQEFQYHRLGLSPDERFQRSDQERLLHNSSPEMDAHDLSSGMHEYSQKTRRGRAHAQPSFSPETSPRSKVARSNSYQRSVVDAKLKVPSPLSTRRCLSNDKSTGEIQEGGREPRSERMELEPPTRDVTNPPVSTLSSPLRQQAPGERTEESSRCSPSHQRTNSNSLSTGPEGILMSNSTVGNTETQTTTLSLDLTSQSQLLHGGEVSGSEFIERMDTQSGRESSEERAGLLSPVYTSRSEVAHATTNKAFWTSATPAVSTSGTRTVHNGENRPGHYQFSTEDSSASNGQRLPGVHGGDSHQDQDVVMISPITCTPHSQAGLDIFPQAFSSMDSNPVRGDVGVRNNNDTSVGGSQVPLLGAGDDEELTPREEDNTRELQFRQHDSQLEDNSSMSSWNHGCIPTSEAAAASSSLTSPVFTAEDSTIDLYASPNHLPPHRDYGVMSPIPEASQELTNSMSMSQSNANRLSGSHMRSQSRIRSVSPISEYANVSGMDATTPSPRHGSVSPFRHSAVTSSNQESTTQRSQSTSEHDSTTLSSALNRPQPQLMDTGTAAAVVMSKDLGEQDRDGIYRHQHHQSRSKSATPVIASGAASREGSVSSTRGEAVHSDRPDVQSEANIAEQLSGTTSSGSREASVSSSTRAQVTIDVSSAVRALTSQPTTQPPSSSSSVQLRGFHSRVTNYSREPLQQLLSSSESIERGGGQVRASTPQSSSSAPARIHSTDSGQRPPDMAARQVSPLTTTAHAQRAIHPQQQQQQFQPQHQQQLQQPQPAANSPHTSKRYSQQRVAELSSSKSQHRINQDIEMMHLAISGMDTTNRSISRTRSSAVPRSQSAIQQTAERQGTTSSSGRVPPHNTATLNMESSRTFRPITPAMMDIGQSRPASAPGTNTATVRPAASSSTSTPVPNSAHTMATAQHQQQQSPSPSVPSNTTVSQSATHSQNSAPQPPRVSTDSYDYLPPYSPPQNGGRSQSQQQRQQQQQQLPVAQQSSQQRPRSRQSSEPPLYPEPPPSYDEIFGGQNSSGRQRRRRGQRRQRGAETLPGANEDGNRRSRSELRRSSSQNEGPIRPSSSQRRLASLTNFFRRARRQTHSGNSQNQSSRAVQSDTNTPTSVSTSAADACPPMDTNEYVANWVESYSRTPRPVEAMEARAEAMSQSVGSTATHSLAYPHVSRAASDVSDSRPHSASYHGGYRGGGGGGSGGSHPVPYRPPPPFPTENADSAVSSYPPAAVRGFSQVSTDYSLSLSRASSDISQSRVSRNNRSQPSSSSSSRPSTNYIIGPGYQQHHTTRPSVGNVSRRGMTREHRRPVSAIVTSEVSTNNTIIDGVLPAHSGTDLVRFDSNNHRASPQQQQQQQQQRQLSRHLDNTAHISTSCFDIASPVPADSEHQHSQHTQEVNVPSSTSRQATEAASTSVEQCAQSNDSVRTTSRQSQILSLSQGNSQGGDSTLAANVNANNINTTAASPRASNASSSSPINVVLVIGSNTSLGQNSQPNPPSPNSNVINLSPTAQEDPTQLAISPTSWSNSERRASAGTSSLSSRAAARQRAEMRLSQRDVSSSDEESSQRSDRSQNGVVRSHRLRHRRRRSQGSMMSQAESLRSNSRVDVQQLSQMSRPSDLRVSSNSRVDVQQLSQTSRPADLREEEMETNVESRALSQDQSHVVNQTDVRPNGTVEEEQEVQTVEVAIEDASEGSTQNHQSLVSSGKSCGHSCEAESQALCCICTVEQGEVHATTEGDIIRMLSNCSLCQRRCNNQIHQTHSYSNKIHSHSQAGSSRMSSQTAAPGTTTTRAAGEVEPQRQRGGKNCVIM